MAEGPRYFNRIADLGEEAGVTFILENLNQAVDHPGPPSPSRDTITLVAGRRPAIAEADLDLYHAQIGEGNLIELCRQALPFIGEIQVADVPGRKEPGTGEINYPAIARALNAMGYEGVIGLEALPPRTTIWRSSASARRSPSNAPRRVAFRHTRLQGNEHAVRSPSSVQDELETPMPARSREFRRALVAVSDALPERAGLAKYGAEVASLAALRRPDINAVVIAPRRHALDLIQARRPARPCSGRSRSTCRWRGDRCRSSRRRGAKFMVGFNRRLDPTFRGEGASRRPDRQGRDGADHLPRPAAPPGLHGASGGLFRDMMIHDFDMARWMLGEEIECFATGSC